MPTYPNYLQTRHFGVTAGVRAFVVDLLCGELAKLPDGGGGIAPADLERAIARVVKDGVAVDAAAAKRWVAAHTVAFAPKG